MVVTRGDRGQGGVGLWWGLWPSWVGSCGLWGILVAVRSRGGVPTQVLKGHKLIHPNFDSLTRA